MLKEKRSAEREISLYDGLETSLEDAGVLLELATEADDADTRQEACEKLESTERDLDAAELRCLLGGEHDASNAIVSINSGAGGTDAADWAEMLLRMYTRWSEQHEYGTEILDIQAGEEAGIRSATFTVTGENAFGYLKAEEGVHRLVRISPFDSQARRHTAFSSVTVFPEIDDSIDVDIDENDLRVDTYRAGGAGSAFGNDSHHLRGRDKVRRAELGSCGRNDRNHTQRAVLHGA